MRGEVSIDSSSMLQQARKESSHGHTRLHWTAARIRIGGPHSARAVPHRGLSRTFSGPNSEGVDRRLVVHTEGGPPAGEALDLGRVHGVAADEDDPRYPLRHEMVKAQYSVARRA